MNMQAAISDPIPTAPPPGVWARPMMEQDLAVLARLRDIALEAAEALGRQIARAEAREAEAAAASSDAVPPPVEPPASEPEPIFSGDLSLALNRVTRAVRMTCALRARLIEELERLGHLQADRWRYRSADARAERKAQVSRVLTRIIEDAAFSEGPDEEDAPEIGVEPAAEGVEGVEGEAETYERLIGEATERLSDRDRIGDVMRRPVSELIDLICRDLGLAPDWRRLAKEAWAQEEMASGNVGAPLTSLPLADGGGARVGLTRRRPKPPVVSENPPGEPPEPATASPAEPPPPPIPALSPIEGDREPEARSSQRVEEPYRGPPGEFPPPGHHAPSALSPDWGFNHGRR